MTFHMRGVYFFLLLIPFLSQGQIRVSGRVVDAESGEALPFAHVGILSTTTSTITNATGDFSLIIEEHLTENSLTVQYIGYTSELIPIRSMNGPATVKLNPSGIALPEITISDKKRSIIEEAIELIPQNHDQGDMVISAFWRSSMRDPDRPIQASETAFDIFRKEGKDVLQIKHGRVARDTSSFERYKNFNGGITPKSLFASSFLVDMNIISKKIRKRSEYGLSDVTSYDGRPVYVVDFDKRVTSKENGFSGQILLDTETLAFVKITFSFSKKNTEPNELFDSWILRRITGLGKSRWTRYNAEFNYKLTDGNWYFSHASFDVIWTLIDNDETFEVPIKYRGDLVVTEISRASFELPDKEYQASRGILVSQSADYTGDFWKDYTVLLPDENFDRIFEQIEARNRARVSD